MRLIILWTIFFTSQSFAFTLLSNPPLKFPVNKVTVNISNDDCSTGAGFSTSELVTMTTEAVDQYWNSVATSALELTVGGIVSTTITGQTSSSGIRSLAANNTIIVGCSSTAGLFGASTLGVGGISSSDSGGVGSVALNNTGGTPLASVTRAQQVATIAHELGHAIGISHSSNDAALMYFSVGLIQENLTQDDKDAVTYLYPHDSLPGSCGTIAFVNRDKGKKLFSQFFAGFFMIILLSGLSRGLTRMRKLGYSA